MPKIATNLQQVREISTKLAMARPEYVYQAPEHQRPKNPIGLTVSCFYVHTNTDVERTPKDAGCYVGNVLHELGVPLEDLQRLEGSAAPILVDHFLTAGTGTELDAIGQYLATAQVAQDGGLPWGEAFTRAERSAVQPRPRV